LELHSPLSLLKQWQRRPDNAGLYELLVIGYTFDLAFIEQRIVGVARGLGARVTLLGDAQHGIHDPVDIRQAGRAYQHGHVVCRGAFHPKLALLVGETDVWVAIGSGNPTCAGWGFNDELWIVIRSQRDTGPQAMVQFGAWLAGIAQHPSVAMPSWISATLIQIADMVTPQTVDDSEPDLQLLGNIVESLMGQLPTGPVASLRLSAPFFDPDGAAVRALVDRMQPAKLTIAIQPTLGSYNGETLTAAVEAIEAAEFRHLSEEGNRISHGKLVEWTDGVTTKAMIGSPNLSRAALLKSTSAGGNCELAVIYPVAQSLLPDGAYVPQDDVRSTSTLPAVVEGRSAAAVTVLGARRTETTVVVELVTSVAATVIIEMSSSAAPGEWWKRHQIDITEASKVIETSFLAPEAAGTAVRATAQFADSRYVSQVVFLTDTAKCLSRVGKSSVPRLTRDYGAIFTDPELLARFEYDLVNLLRANAVHRVAQPASRAGATAPGIDDDDRWGAWLNTVETVLGPSLAAGLFPTATVVGATVSANMWSIDSDDPIAASPEDDEVIDADAAEDSARREPPDIPAELRQRYRQWANRLRRGIGHDPPPSVDLRMLVTQLHLDLLAAGVWGPDGNDWLDCLAEVLVRTPPAGDEIPERGEPYLGALVAVGLALMSGEATLSGGRPSDIVFQRTWDQVSLWAAMANPDLIDHYLYQPTQTYSRVADREQVDAVVALAQAVVEDPNARIRAAFEEEGIDSVFVDGAWVAECGSAQPRALAVRLATLIGEHSNKFAVLARGERGCCVLLCCGSTLAVAESTSRIWRVATKRVSFANPGLMFSEGLPPGKTFPRRPGTALPDQVAELADEIGVNAAQLTAALR
jgi:hypothetical protein